MTEREPTGRVTVTHPRTVATRRKSPTSVGVGVDGTLGDAELRELMSEQLRLSLRYLVLVGVLLAATPLLLANSDWFAQHRVFGVPISWLLVGAGFFPLFILVGFSYVRAVDDLENRFSSNDSAPDR